jgi:hypothetical protein
MGPGRAYVEHDPEFFWHWQTSKVVIGSFVYLAANIGQLMR